MLEQERARRKIDELILGLDDWRGERLAEVRLLVHEALPGVVETWKWMGSPVWEQHGVVLVGNAHKAKVKLTLRARGAADRPGRPVQRRSCRRCLAGDRPAEAGRSRRGRLPSAGPGSRGPQRLIRAIADPLRTPRLARQHPAGAPVDVRLPDKITVPVSAT